MKSDYSYKIENINFILIFLIVCLHSSMLDFTSSSSILSEVYRFINCVCDVAVPTFFVISSYLYFKNFQISKYTCKIRSRIRSLVIPYFMWSTLTYLYYAILTNMPFIKSIVNENFVEFSLSSALDNIIFAKCAGPIWFIRVIFIYTLISPIVYFIGKKTKNIYSQILMFVTLVIFSIVFNASYDSFVFWLPVHYLGCIFAMYIKKINIINKSKMNNMLMFVVTTVLLVVSFLQDNDKSIIYSIFRFLSPFCVMYFTDCKFLNKRLFYTLDSFFIYCSHIIFIQIIRKILLMIFGSNVYCSLIIYILTIFLTIIIIYFITLFMKKNMKKMYYLLIGNRVRD